MYGDAFSGGDAGESEHQSGGAVADHQFAFLPETLQYGHQILIPGIRGVLSEDRNGISAGENQRIVLLLVSFQIGDHSVDGQCDARVGADLPRGGYGEYLVGNLVFIKCFQILEQPHPVYGIDGCNCNFLGHVSLF